MKAAQRQSETEQRNEQPQSQKQAVAKSSQLETPAQATRTCKTPALKPELHEVIAAVQSIYADNMKPYGRLLRKRIAEHDGLGSSDRLPEVDLQHLRAICEASGELRMAPEVGGDWSVTFTNRPSSFVDVS